MPVESIDDSVCIGCGACEYYCHADVIHMAGTKARLVFPQDCEGCSICVSVCPVGCIHLEKIAVQPNISGDRKNLDSKIHYWRK